MMHNIGCHIGEQLLYLFVEFFKIGLFSFGGGYATMPFLYHISDNYHWFSYEELTRMLAISSITPGPVGLNVATFAGFKTAGALGSVTATLAIMLPSFAIVILISKVLKKFKDNFYVQSILYGLRPAAAAMLGAVAIRLFNDSIFAHNAIDIKGILLFCFLILFSFRVKKDPLIYLLIGGLFGILLNFHHILNIFKG